MSNKHTPGPWVIKSEPSACKDYTERNIVFPGIDASVGARKKAVDPFVIATVNSVYFGPHDEEPEANARLIAAAPELVRELEQAANALLWIAQEAEQRSGVPKAIIGGVRHHAKNALSLIKKAIKP